MIRAARQGMANAVLWISFLTGISKILGFVREMIIAAFFGASGMMDAFNIADMIISMSASVIQAVFLLSFLPIYNVLFAKDQEEANRFANVVLNAALIVLGVLSVIFVLGLPHGIRWIVPGFSEEKIQQTLALTYIMLPVVTISLLVSFFSALQQSAQRFFFPAIIGIPYNVVLVSSLYLFHREQGVFSLSYGIVIGVLSMLLVQFFGMRQLGYRYQAAFDWRSPTLWRMLRLSAPLMVGIFSAQANLLVDRMLASDLPEGSISALSYANRVFMVFITVFAVPAATVLFPRLAQQFSRGEEEAFAVDLTKSLRMLLFILLPLVFLLYFWGHEIVTVLFRRGAFDALAAEKTGRALSCFSGAVIGISLTDVLSKAFYARLHSLLPAAVALVGVFLNMGLNFLFVAPWGHVGLAAATSLATLFTAALLLIFLARQCRISVGGVLAFALKLAIFLVCVCGALRTGTACLAKWMFLSPPVVLGLVVTVGGAVYLLGSQKFRVSEADFVIGKIVALGGKTRAFFR